MSRAGIAVVIVTAVGLFAGSTYAQQSGNSRRPNQTPDKGVDDDKAAPGRPARILASVP